MLNERIGKINCNVWTVSGDVSIEFEYRIILIDEENWDIFLTFDESYEFDEDTLKDVFQQCLDDSQKKDSVCMMKGYNFSIN